MSDINKKTLAGLLLGIGAFAAYAHSKNKSGSRSMFPPPSGKVPKPSEGFSREQDDIFFSFKQNAPKKSISTKFGPDLDARRQEKQKISQLQSQKSSKQQALQQLQRSLSQDTFGDAAAVAQMQNKVNSIKAQIENANNLITGLNYNLSMDSDDASEVSQWQAEKETALSQLEDAEQRLLAVANVIPQAQKTRMQAQVTSVISQVADLNNQISTAKAKLANLQGKIRTDSATGDDYTFAEYFTEFSERGYDSDAQARYGAAGDAAWDEWKSNTFDRYAGYGSSAPKFDGTASDSSSALSGQGLKTGIKSADFREKFDGTESTNPFMPKGLSLPPSLD